MIRIICISDTHGLHTKIKIENYINPKVSNILLHAGDCTNVGKENEIIDFVQWFQNIKGFDCKIFIAGNHDFGFENYNGIRHHNEAPWLHHILNEENLSQSDVVYLHDSEFTYEHPDISKPLKIYGSPWQPEFYNWAFNLPRNGNELKEKWNQIPDDTDILITHGPPHGIRDFVVDRSGALQVGCELLRQRVDNMNLLLHVFGHIHGAYGPMLINDTAFVNASTCTERYHPINKPIVLDVKEIDKKLTIDLVDM